MSQRPQITRRDPTRTLVLTGIAAVVIAGVIGVISFRATSGLPFQSRYHVTVEVPNANRLLATNDVRVAGVRVGQVADVEGIPSTPPRARVELALESLGALPVDSRARIRPASVLGASYVELTPGTSEQDVPEGGTLHQPSAAAPVELPDLFRIFDRSAGRNFQRAVSGLGTSVAGRGTDLNAAIGAASRLALPVTRIARTLVEPVTQLPRLIGAYHAFVDALAPVSRELRDAFSGGARTLAALDASPLGAALDAAPGAERATARAFVAVRPALDRLTKLAVTLRAAGPHLVPALTQANDMLGAGIRPLRALPPLSAALRPALTTLTSVSRRASTGGALRKLDDLMRETSVLLARLTPAQVYCNVIPLAMQGIASFAGTLGEGQGPSFSVLNFKTIGASGTLLQSAAPSRDLHVSYTPRENKDECEAGQEPFDGARKQLGPPPGLQTGSVQTGDIPMTYPPPGVLDRARRAGLIVGGR